MEGGQQQITAHLLRRFRGQPENKKINKVPGEVLKMAVGLKKGKHRCGGGRGADMEVN